MQLTKEELFIYFLILLFNIITLFIIFYNRNLYYEESNEKRKWIFHSIENEELIIENNFFYLIENEKLFSIIIKNNSQDKLKFIIQNRIDKDITLQIDKKNFLILKNKTFSFVIDKKQITFEMFDIL